MRSVGNDGSMPPRGKNSDAGLLCLSVENKNIRIRNIASQLNIWWLGVAETRL
jgi:hypothetical protein